MGAQKPLMYLKNELFPGSASDFMSEWRELDSDTKSTLKQWAKEEQEAIEAES